MIAKTPKTPYYAVIFTSVRTTEEKGYEDMAEKMMQLAKQQPGFLGLEAARNHTGITVSYWINEESIKLWRNNFEHRIAQKMGKEIWYQSFKIRVVKVERDYGFEK